MLAILFRRAWLLWGPVVVACQLALTWVVERWVTWEWLRGTATVLAWVVYIGVALWGVGSVAILTRSGFWVPFLGRGRWSDVVVRNGLDVVLRVSLEFGVDNTISFDRVAGARIERILDGVLPSSLPGEAATEPHPEWRKGLEQKADRLLGAVAERRLVPTCTRSWIRPTADGYEVHRLRLDFEPSGDGRLVAVTFAGWGYPRVWVDGLYAALEVGRGDEFDPGDEVDSDDADDEALAETVDLLVAVFGEGRREPLEAWQIIDPHDRSWKFFPVELR